MDSTNPVKSMIEIARERSRRVKHWASGWMAPRWAAAGMTGAETQFRRVKGFPQLPDLARALKHKVGYQHAQHEVPLDVTA